MYFTYVFPPSVCSFSIFRYFIFKIITHSTQPFILPLLSSLPLLLSMWKGKLRRKFLLTYFHLHPIFSCALPRFNSHTFKPSKYRYPSLKQTSNEKYKRKFTSQPYSLSCFSFRCCFHRQLSKNKTYNVISPISSS